MYDVCVCSVHTLGQSPSVGEKVDMYEDPGSPSLTPRTFNNNFLLSSTTFSNSGGFGSILKEF